MPICLCRWPNGDVSLAAGESEVEIADILDEVDNPDSAELIELDHAVAVHFTLGKKPGEEGALPLQFESLSEQLESSLYRRAYPVYNAARSKADVTIKELMDAIKHEKSPIYRKEPEPSSNPVVAQFQDEFQMPRIVLENLAGRALAAEQPSGEVTEGDVRRILSNPIYCMGRTAAWVAQPPEPIIPVEQWIAAGAKLVEEIGAEAYLRLLIQNLRGDEE